MVLLGTSLPETFSISPPIAVPSSFRDTILFSEIAENVVSETPQTYNILKGNFSSLGAFGLTNTYVVTDVLFHDISGCIGHNGADTSTPILSLPGPSKPVAEEQMDKVRAVLENDSSTTTSLIEYFSKTAASQDILEEISPLPSSSDKERERKKSAQVKRPKLITHRTSEEDLKMKAKMELNSEEEKREGDEENHCIICAETFEEIWIQCRICKGWEFENCADLEGNNLFYECDVYFTKNV
ncbi:hypothetical protein AVEN_123488-1 [Araneus ventricosus]|uniref:Uncharacterized protein n=1 Tax=Araneus ventricosus TaxID=182803 RepID=A0A4Y2P0K4_ARAVE|nr:hypothetical protein AVEN_123488-1 [Araneus ventricosus]